MDENTTAYGDETVPEPPHETSPDEDEHDAAEVAVKPVDLGHGSALSGLVLKLSRSPGGVSNTHLEPWNPTFADLCDAFRQRPPVGAKDGPYFVRGPCREGSSTRADSNIESASVVVLDGDSTLDPESGEISDGAPDPKGIHEALKSLGISHCLYTTYSHDPEGKGNRYRITIPAVTHDPGDLKGIDAWIFHLLAEKGYFLVNVRENGSWSQPWYLPRLASETSDYICLTFDSGRMLDISEALAWFQAQDPADLIEKTQVDALSPPRNPDSLFSRFNARYGNPEWLLKTLQGAAYTLERTQQINDEAAYRLLSPHSATGNAGVVLFCGKDGTWRVFSHHGADDPLSNPEGEWRSCDAWDIYVRLIHAGNEKAAREAGEGLCDPRAKIRILPGEISPMLAEAVQALAGMEPPTVYQRANSLCRIAHLEETSETEGCSIPKGTAHVVSLQRAGLTVELSRAIRWEKRGRKGGWQKTDPCPKTTAALLEAVGNWGAIPPLLGISEAPILRPDGTLLASPGYDRATRLYVEGSFPSFVLPEHPGLDEARLSAEQLLHPFREFPFVDKALGQAVLLAYLLTLALRPQLITAPIFCISATTPGSGKGLIIEAANRLVRGRDAATMPPVHGGSGEEETRKRITALLLHGVCSINLDNWVRAIGGEALNAMLTASEWTDRKLGVSATVSLPIRVTLAATGNNLTAKGDTIRRALLIELDPGMERPELRTFEETDLLGMIARERQSLLKALFTILKAYQCAGSPGNRDNLLGRFESWTAAVCGPIRWLGFPDPLDSQERLREQDPETDRLELLLSAWYAVFSTQWVTAGEVVDQAVEEDANHAVNRTARSVLNEALSEVVPDGRGSVNRNRLGWFLRDYTGRIAGGYRLEKKPRSGKKTKNPQQYRVTQLETQEDDNSAQDGNKP
jgi:hypothetical protein